MFTIQLETRTAAPPSHRVTLVNSQDAPPEGWNVDIDGPYIGGAWTFTFDEASYGNEFVFKFRLDKVDWMLGENLTINLRPPPEGPIVYNDGSVKFPSLTPGDSGASSAPSVSGNVPQQVAYSGQHYIELALNPDDFAATASARAAGGK